ncbi:hypothetical protein EVAR_57292_1 [Eumeta japonica]|uniref:Uncharacterized protein n=1 Tax=Eumeta variegata TaxID=151549 RepID=A0A4C1YQT6_EUMVA|nr:hypothetical protein EVAR_57292_1 [Eumeta japonica]
MRSPSPINPARSRKCYSLKSTFKRDSGCGASGVVTGAMPRERASDVGRSIDFGRKRRFCWRKRIPLSISSVLVSVGASVRRPALHYLWGVRARRTVL